MWLGRETEENVECFIKNSNSILFLDNISVYLAVPLHTPVSGWEI